MRPNQRVWGFLLVFAGAAPKTSGFWKMAPFSSRELAVGTGPHPDASIQKSGHECIGRLACRPRRTAGETSPKLLPATRNSNEPSLFAQTAKLISKACSQG